MRWWTCIALCVAVAAESETGNEVWMEVKIAEGPVRGHKDSNWGLYAFYNIPYATAPTGNDKFKAPLPAPTWTETFDAVDKGIMCPQFILKPFIPENMKAQENCLITNIFVPDTKEKKLPVLVYIHGGGFQLGYGDWVKTKNLMKNKDVIIVNFNYRLGIHGFLCLGTEGAPGNAGMKDQVMALRWVQKNIAAFGGNPNDVTVTGYSAGSASVDLLMLAKPAEGLFHKVIPESGANLGTFAVQLNPLYNAQKHAKTLNFTNIDDINALEQFYQTASYGILTADPYLDIADSSAMFAPCIERDSNDEAFLTESPLSILKRGDYRKLPLLYGFANMEGLIRKDYFNTWKDRMNERFSDYLPGNLQFKSDEEKEEVAKLVKKFYFGDKPISENNILSYIDYFSDVIINYGMLRAVKLHAKAGHDQVYLYEYSFVDEDTPIIPHTNVRGADHCAQTLAIVDGANLLIAEEDNISEEYKNMKRIIREMWLNFVKTGKPVPNGSSLPTWPAAGADGSPHMSLGRKLELRGVLLEERTRFWDKIYEKYHQEPKPPPAHLTRIEL